MTSTNAAAGVLAALTLLAIAGAAPAQRISREERLVDLLVSVGGKTQGLVDWHGGGFAAVRSADGKPIYRHNFRETPGGMMVDDLLLGRDPAGKDKALRRSSERCDHTRWEKQ